MDLKRFFTDAIDHDYAFLEGKEFYHAVKVVRLKVGYKLIICNNTGLDYYCTVEEIGKDRLKAKIDNSVSNDTEMNYFSTLYIGINKDIDTAVQKAVELGARRIVPFTSQHGNISDVNYDRLNTIVLEASKQCGRAILASIENVVSFSQIGENTDEEIVAFYEFERNNKVSDVKISKKKIGIVIGCEGGFSENEYKTMLDKGFHVLTLGRRILRVSTAVVSALTLINERMGEV